MYLTAWEERALNGEFGESLALAMRIIVRVGEALGAERLIPISHAHVSGISVHNIGVEGVELIEDIVRKGGRVVVYTTANPCSLAYLQKFKNIYGEEVYSLQHRLVKALITMGVDAKSFTCIPYMLRRPSIHEHLAWSESSAVIYANSVIGARSNREAGFIALMAAISGRTYYAGLHKDENRIPQLLIDVEFEVNSIALASALGLYLGTICREIPFIRMRFSASSMLRQIMIKNMLASIATTSDLGMVYLDGITPDIHRIRIDIQSLERVRVDINDVKNYMESCHASILLIGCPHLTVSEIKTLFGTETVVHQLKSLNIEKILIATPKLSEDFEKELYNDIGRHFIKHGIEFELLPGVCPVVSDLRKVNMLTVMTIHGKAAHYMPRVAGVRTCLIDML
ncbi:MAG TPA: DUF521 domain-containing protein [Ignisphaera sp.]|nr:DUF521 domain-containing protein [Ignisphaera sp.]